MKIRGAIFDADGTLLDSMSAWMNLGERYLDSLQIKPEENLSEKIMDMSLLQAVQYLKKTYAIDKTEQEMMDEVNGIIETFYRNEVSVKPGVSEFLWDMKERGIRMCVATATDFYLVDMAFKQNGIRSCFDQIFTCSQVGAGKDDPKIYEQALSYLGTDKKDTVVFEDAVYAIQTAKQAGFVVTGVYDESADQEMVQDLSDYYIRNFAEMGGVFYENSSNNSGK